MRNADAFNGGGDGDLAGLLGEVGDRVGGLADTLRGLNAEVAEGADPTGAVVARVSGTGRLLGLVLAPRAARDLDHVAMAAAIMSAIGAAHEVMGERLTKAMEEFEGARPSADPSADPLAPYVQALLREE